MSEIQNTQTVQQGYEKFGAGDLQGLLSLFADDIQWTVPAIENAPYSGSRRGKTAVSDFFRQLAENEDITEFVPKEFIAQGDKVVVLGRSTATVKATRRTFSTDWVHIFTVKDGKVTAFLEFFDNAAANRAFQKAATA
jgi:uncharacterized protein